MQLTARLVQQVRVHDHLNTNSLLKLTPAKSTGTERKLNGKGYKLEKQRNIFDIFPLQPSFVLTDICSSVIAYQLDFVVSLLLASARCPGLCFRVSHVSPFLSNLEYYNSFSRNVVFRGCVEFSPTCFFKVYHIYNSFTKHLPLAGIQLRA